MNPWNTLVVDPMVNVLVGLSWVLFSNFGLAILVFTLLVRLVLLPLTLIQTAGLRRPINQGRKTGPALGAGVGVLYAATTISGPPLAMALNNRGFAPEEFRAALGLIRLAESALAATAYWYAGMFNRESLALVPVILPSLAIGVPLWVRGSFAGSMQRSSDASAWGLTPWPLDSA